MLNKTKYDVVRTINFEDGLGPKGLFIDKYDNILTVLNEFNDNKTIGEKRLYIKNLKNEDCVQLVEYDKHEWFYDYAVEEDEENEDEDDDDFKTESFLISENTFIICYKRIIGVFRLK